MRRAVLAGEALPNWVQKHPRGDYIVRLALSCPEWADREALRALQQKARRLTVRTGKLHVLDHIIPLQHRDVCGLTVQQNLRVVPAACNAVKHNRWHPNQGELFHEPEQLTLFHGVRS